MSTMYLMYPEAVRNELNRRLHAADDERRRRLARRRFPPTRRARSTEAI